MVAWGNVSSPNSAYPTATSGSIDAAKSETTKVARGVLGTTMG
jgi:hypothetical protein